MGAQVASGTDREGRTREFECEAQEEHFKHGEVTLRGTWKCGWNGKTGGDDGKERDKKVMTETTEMQGVQLIGQVGFPRTESSRSFGGQDQCVGSTMNHFT